MSDTPRTDAQWYKATPTYGSPEVVSAKFARELERELSAAQARIADLTRERDSLRADAERYRWLKMESGTVRSAAKLDAYIDAAQAPR